MQIAPRRFLSIASGMFGMTLLLTVAVSTPALAQGREGERHAGFGEGAHRLVGRIVFVGPRAHGRDEARHRQGHRSQGELSRDGDGQ